MSGAASGNNAGFGVTLTAGDVVSALSRRARLARVKWSAFIATALFDHGRLRLQTHHVRNAVVTLLVVVGALVLLLRGRGGTGLRVTGGTAGAGATRPQLLPSLAPSDPPSVSNRAGTAKSMVAVYPDGSRIRAFPIPDYYWANVGEFEPTVFAAMRAVLDNRRGAFIDIGAYVGVQSLWAAQYTKVYALEADPLAFGWLQENFELNPSLGKSAFLYQMCIAEAAGKATMKGIKAEGVHEESGKHSWEVTCNTLPDFCEEYEIEPGFVALVDIDVEGYELTLLPALLEWTTEFFQPAIMVSMHWNHYPGGNSADNRARLLPFFRSYDYVYDVTGSSSGGHHLVRIGPAGSGIVDDATLLRMPDLGTYLLSPTPVELQGATL